MAQLKVCSENPQTRAREEAVYDLPDGLASILDRKVDGTGLNCLEQLVDFLCMMLYDTYGKMSDLKTVLQRHGHDIGHTEQVSIWHMHGGTLLYDLTPEQAGGLRFMQTTVQGQTHTINCVTLRTDAAARRVLLFEVLQLTAMFGDPLVIKKNPDGKFLLTEEGPTTKTWLVNANPSIAQYPSRAEEVHFAQAADYGAKEKFYLSMEHHYAGELARLGFMRKNPEITEQGTLRIYDDTAGHKVDFDAQGRMKIDGMYIDYRGNSLPIYPPTKGGVVTVKDFTRADHEAEAGYIIEHSHGGVLPIFIPAKSHLD